VFVNGVDNQNLYFVSNSVNCSMIFNESFDLTLNTCRVNKILNTLHVGFVYFFAEIFSWYFSLLIKNEIACRIHNA